MSKYLYNGIEFEELPDSSIWPRPYKTIYWSQLGVYYAVLSDSPYQYVEAKAVTGASLGTLLCPIGNCAVLESSTTGNWNLFYKCDSETASAYIGPQVIYEELGDTVIWVNHAIRYEDGGLYREADDDPIPVEPEEPEKKNFCLKSWLIGFVLALAGKPLPLGGGKREPVAYLYNGVRLSKLPEWDEEKYPHLVLFIGKSSIDGSILYVADALAEAPVVTRFRSITDREYYLRLVTVENTGHVYFGTCKMDGVDDEWNTPWENVSGYTGRQIETLTGTNESPYELLWSSCDIHYADDYYDVELAGTLYHEADSDPIPVYDTAEVTTDG